MVIQRKSKDCGVFAWHKLMDVPYDQALATMRRFGFSSTYGVFVDAWVLACDRLNVKYEKITFKGSCTEAALQFGAGRYLVHVEQHVMPMIDAIVWNCNDIHLQMRVINLIRIC